jgi:hypothetical protein
MDETSLLINDTSTTQSTSYNSYLTNIGVGALKGMGSAICFMAFFSGICLRYDNCAYTVYGVLPKTPEDNFKEQYMVYILASSSLVFGALAGACVAKWCPSRTCGCEY